MHVLCGCDRPSNRSDRIMLSFPELLDSLVFKVRKRMLRMQNNSRIKRLFGGSKHAGS